MPKALVHRGAMPTALMPSCVSPSVRTGQGCGDSSWQSRSGDSVRARLSLCGPWIWPPIWAVLRARQTGSSSPSLPFQKRTRWRTSWCLYPACRRQPPTYRRLGQHRVRTKQRSHGQRERTSRVRRRCVGSPSPQKNSAWRLQFTDTPFRVSVRMAGFTGRECGCRSAFPQAR